MLFPVPSSGLDFPARSWLAVVFSPGGDGGSGLLEEKLWRWSFSQLGWYVDSRSDMPFARLFLSTSVEPQ
jgi:hypothetical protein